MSTTERSPMSSRYRRSSASVLEDGMRLAKKREHLNSISPTETTIVEDSVGTFEDVNVLDSPIDFADESTPLYDELTSGRNESDTELAPDSTEQHSVLTASSRVGRLLQRLSDRLENGAEHADTTIDYVNRTGRTAVRGIGRAAVAGTELAVGTTLLTASMAARGVKRFGDASGDAMIAGLGKVETAMDKTGKAIDTRAANVKNKYQTFQFNRETKASDRQFRKEYARETKAFDKTAARDSKVLAKQEKIDMKQAKRDDVKFERLMRKIAANDRKTARRAKWASRLNGLKNTGASGIEATKGAVKSGIDTSRDFAEKSKQRARVTRMAGKMALQTYRDSKEAFKTN